MFPCKCGKSFTEKRSLTRHNAVVHECSGVVKCVPCNKEYRADSYARHVRRVHSGKRGGGVNINTPVQKRWREEDDKVADFYGDTSELVESEWDHIRTNVQKGPIQEKYNYRLPLDQFDDASGGALATPRNYNLKKARELSDPYVYKNMRALKHVT